MVPLPGALLIAATLAAPRPALPGQDGAPSPSPDGHPRRASSARDDAAPEVTPGADSEAGPEAGREAGVRAQFELLDDLSTRVARAEKGFRAALHEPAIADLDEAAWALDRELGELEDAYLDLEQGGTITHHGARTLLTGSLARELRRTREYLLRFEASAAATRALRELHDDMAAALRRGRHEAALALYGLRRGDAAASDWPRHVWRLLRAVDGMAERARARRAPKRVLAPPGR